jgi:hypothetical protein
MSFDKDIKERSDRPIFHVWVPMAVLIEQGDSERSFVQFQ